MALGEERGDRKTIPSERTSITCIPHEKKETPETSSKGKGTKRKPGIPPRVAPSEVTMVTYKK